MNPYKVLGVKPNATGREIKTAYRREAMAHHPDRMEDDDPVQFQIISLAYEILKDPDKRARCDATGQTEDDTPAQVMRNQLITNCIDSGDWSGDIVEDMRRQVGHAMEGIEQATNSCGRELYEIKS